MINTARSSSGIILSGNPKDPQRKAMVLPLLSMAIIDMFPSATQLTSSEWKENLWSTSRQRMVIRLTNLAENSQSLICIKCRKPALLEKSVELLPELRKR